MKIQLVGLVFRSDEGFSTRNISSRDSLQWPVYIIKSVYQKQIIL